MFVVASPHLRDSDKIVFFQGFKILSLNSFVRLTYILLTLLSLKKYYKL